jgi:hypothetical protein
LKEVFLPKGFMETYINAHGDFSSPWAFFYVGAVITEPLTKGQPAVEPRRGEAATEGSIAFIPCCHCRAGGRCTGEEIMKKPILKCESAFVIQQYSQGCPLFSLLIALIC